jgi:ketosteroid isomerase-like protein
MMTNVRTASLLLALMLTLPLLTAGARAGVPPPSPAAEVLAQEGRWLTAIVNGDTRTIAALLVPSFKHTTAQGTLLNRTQELASVRRESFSMNATAQTVDFAGDAAIVHGANTLTSAGKTVARERYTDVYVKQNGTWMALSAQETNIAP